MNLFRLFTVQERFEAVDVGDERFAEGQDVVVVLAARHGDFAFAVDEVNVLQGDFVALTGVCEFEDQGSVAIGNQGDKVLDLDTGSLGYRNNVFIHRVVRNDGAANGDRVYIRVHIDFNPLGINIFIGFHFAVELVCFFHQFRLSRKLRSFLSLGFETSLFFRFGLCLSFSLQSGFLGKSGLFGEPRFRFGLRFQAGFFSKSGFFLRFGLCFGFCLQAGLFCEASFLFCFGFRLGFGFQASLFSEASFLFCFGLCLSFSLQASFFLSLGFRFGLRFQASLFFGLGFCLSFSLQASLFSTLRPPLSGGLLQQVWLLPPLWPLLRLLPSGGPLPQDELPLLL